MLVRRATPSDVLGICDVCSTGWRDTYADIHSADHIERVIEKYYNPARVLREITPTPDWNGWYIATLDSVVIGSGGGGIQPPATGEIYVLYVHPAHRYRGAGTALLNAITAEMSEQGATTQFASVHPKNDKGLPFYRSRGFVDHGFRGGTSGHADSFLLRRAIGTASTGSARSLTASAL